MLITSASSSKNVLTNEATNWSPYYRKPMEKLFWIWGRSLYWYWFQMKCYGLESIPQDRPYIIAANHSSHLDAGAIITSLWQKTDGVYCLVAKDYFCDRFVKEWFVRTFFNAIPFDRRGQSIDGIRDCDRVVDKRRPVIVFPEGTRSRTGKLQPFKPGLGFLALQLNVPIVPVYIEGTYQALPKGKWVPHRHPIQVHFGSPLEIMPYLGKQEKVNSRQLYQEIVNDVSDAIARLQAVK